MNKNFNWSALLYKIVRRDFKKKFRVFKIQPYRQTLSVYKDLTTASGNDPKLSQVIEFLSSFSSSFSAVFHTLVLLTKALNIVDSNENFQRFLSQLNRCILKFPCVYLQRAYFHYWICYEKIMIIFKIVNMVFSSSFTETEIR